MWNSLPSSVVSSKTIEEFKAQIKIIGTEVWCSGSGSKAD